MAGGEGLGEGAKVGLAGGEAVLLIRGSGEGPAIPPLLPRGELVPPVPATSRGAAGITLVTSAAVTPKADARSPEEMAVTREERRVLPMAEVGSDT